MRSGGQAVNTGTAIVKAALGVVAALVLARSATADVRGLIEEQAAACNYTAEDVEVWSPPPRSTPRAATRWSPWWRKTSPSASPRTSSPRC